MERMKEYIEKAEIIRAIAAEASHCLTLNKPAEARGYIGAKELIERRKAADVAEVRHGRWILEREPDGTPYCFHCSVCDNDFHHIGIMTATDYCPNCGARMGKEAEHETD